MFLAARRVDENVEIGLDRTDRDPACLAIIFAGVFDLQSLIPIEIAGRLEGEIYGRRLIVDNNYAYDTASRLTDLDHNLDGSTTTDDQNFDFSFTAASQISNRTISNDLYSWANTAAARTYARNGLNQYTSTSGTGATSFTYDPRGNLTGDGTRTFTYDYENHLRTTTGAVSLTLNYDPLGRLIRTADGTSTTELLYDGDRLIAEYNGTTLLRRYVHGPGVDEPIVRYEGTGTSDRRYEIADHQGSIIAENGSSTTRFTYGPYGEPGNWNGARFRYTGQTTLDANLSALTSAQLYHYKARVYDPVLGRFMQTDSVGYEDDLNLYAFVGSDPLNALDPNGQRKEYNWTSASDLTIHLPIAVDPSSVPMAGTTPADIAARTAADFNGQYAYTDGSTINVTVDVQFVPWNIAQVNAGAVNTLKVRPGIRPQTNAVGGDAVAIRDNSTSGVVSHELGHVAGAPDQYTDVAQPSGGFASVPNAGFAGNVMGDPNTIYSPTPVPGAADQRNFTDIFGVRPDTEICVPTGGKGRCP